MKLVIQRVTSASVKVDGNVCSEIGRGLLVLMGIEQGDAMDQVNYLAPKLLKLRLWPDLKEPGKQWASSVVDNGFELLVVSQFTLFATFKKPKPDFHQAMGGDQAQQLYEAFIKKLAASDGPKAVATGVFGALMQVELCNDGPVTVELVSNPETSKSPETSTPSATPKSTATPKGTTETVKPAKTAKTSAESAESLETILAQQPYLGGFTPSAKDAKHFEAMQKSNLSGPLQSGSAPAPHTARWFEHIRSFSQMERSQWVDFSE
ncbi:unnamed protein product [Cladocopium goreaui]|uniref:D-aminoacyl-tRNA deacylase n=1 Tax=Cladocopium goreaui TaxID=2562237 RepID=A0A9P1BNA2_9DINO|nr:unnamed protein product [Cladocopium goreaui]